MVVVVVVAVGVGVVVAAAGGGEEKEEEYSSSITSLLLLRDKHQPHTVFLGRNPCVCRQCCKHLAPPLLLNRHPNLQWGHVSLDLF